MPKFKENGIPHLCLIVIRSSCLTIGLMTTAFSALCSLMLKYHPTYMTITGLIFLMIGTNVWVAEGVLIYFRVRFKRIPRPDSTTPRWIAVSYSPSASDGKKEITIYRSTT